MATVNVDKLFDVTNLNVGSYDFDARKYQGLKADNKTLEQMKGYTYQILTEADGDHKAGDLKITVAANTFVYVAGYKNSNGKSKCKYLAGSDYEEHGFGDLVDDALVTNPTAYTVETVNPKKSVFTTTAYNDTVNLSGFDTIGEHVITKGFNVKTDKGNDTITGSLLNDTINAGDGNDSITASYGNDAYTLGKGSNTATYNKANLAEGFGTDTYTLTKEETVTLNQNYDAAQVKYNVKGNDAVVDVYSKSHVGYSKVEVSYDDEATRNYFDTQKVTSKDGATIDLKVTFQDAEITTVQEWDPDLNDGVGGYAEANVKEKYTGIVTAESIKQYQRVYAVAGEEEGTLDPDKSHLIEAVAVDFTDHTSLTYLVKTQDYEAALSDDGKKVVWNEDGAATYEAAATGKVGTTHSYTYNVGGYDGTEGTARSVSVADLKKVYVVQDTKSTAYVYDGEAEPAPYWTLGEVSVHEYAVVKKAGDETTTYYQVLTAENGAVALVKTTEEVITASDINPETLAVYTEDELKLGAVVFKNYASKNDATVKVGETDLATLAKHDVTLDNKNVKFTSTRLASEVDVAAGTNKALTVDLSKSQYANDNGGHNAINLVNATGKVTVKGSAQDDGVVDNAGNGTYTLGKGNNTLTYTDGLDTVNLTSTENLTVNMAGAHFKVVKNDVIAYTADNHSITFKNFAAKDPDATVTVDGTNLEEYDYETTWGDEIDVKAKSFTGSRLNDSITAAAFETTVAEPTDKTKGVTIDAKGGDNDVTGSAYADVIKAGDGEDTITASAGNDTYTLGAGVNTADYTSATATGTDTYNLSNDETLVLTNLDNEATFEKKGNDIIVKNANDAGKEIVLKNVVTGKVDAEVYVGNPEDPDTNLWDQNIEITATSATVTGTRANDDITSERAAATTFVSSYTADLGFGNDTITVDDEVVKTAADTIKITTSDKNVDKLSAYDFGYTFGDDTITVTSAKGSVAYTADDLDDLDLNLIDATNTKWAFVIDNEASEEPLDLTKAKTNNIVSTVNDVVDSKKNDIIFAAVGAEDQEFTYQAGKDKYVSTIAGSDDVYTLLNGLDKKTTLVISDNLGDNELNLKAEEKYVRFFNVKASEEADYASDLVILNESTYFNTKGAIVKAAQSLQDDFAAGTVVLRGAVAYDAEAEEPAEKTAVANFTINHGTASNNKTYDEIRSTVANWLATEGYEDSMAVLAGNDKGDIATLMQIYSAGAVPNA